ncbi:toxin glutamine deamidase domain-containing protein, partial [Saccharopolyspora shandongensis]|uniref:toxin glutamine deamidase domain-containing protein n=1 Tax=Saccharopolyspora shandongensis TaxID=418495 RepID=UPI00340D40D1
MILGLLDQGVKDRSSHGELLTGVSHLVDGELAAVLDRLPVTWSWASLYRKNDESRDFPLEPSFDVSVGDLSGRTAEFYRNAVRLALNFLQGKAIRLSAADEQRLFWRLQGFVGRFVASQRHARPALNVEFRENSQDREKWVKELLDRALQEVYEGLRSRYGLLLLAELREHVVISLLPGARNGLRLTEISASASSGSRRRIRDHADTGGLAAAGVVPQPAFGHAGLGEGDVSGGSVVHPVEQGEQVVGGDAPSGVDTLIGGSVSGGVGVRPGEEDEDDDSLFAGATPSGFIESAGSGALPEPDMDDTGVPMRDPGERHVAQSVAADEEFESFWLGLEMGADFADFSEFTGWMGGHVDVGQGGAAAVVEPGTASDIGPDAGAQRKRQASDSGRHPLEPPGKRVRPDSPTAADEVMPEPVVDPGPVDSGLTHSGLPDFDLDDLDLDDLDLDDFGLTGLDLPGLGVPGFDPAGLGPAGVVLPNVGEQEGWWPDFAAGDDGSIGAVPAAVDPSITDIAVVPWPDLAEYPIGFTDGDLFETRAETVEGAVEPVPGLEGSATPKVSQPPLEEPRSPAGRTTAHTQEESASGMSPSREHRTALSDDDIARLNPAGLDCPASAGHPFGGKPAGMPTDSWSGLATKSKVVSEPAIHADSVSSRWARRYIKSEFPHLLSVNAANFLWYDHLPRKLRPRLRDWYHDHLSDSKPNNNCAKCIEATDKAMDNIAAKAPWVTQPAKTGTAIRNYFHTTEWNQFYSWDAVIRHLKKTQLGSRAIVYVEKETPKNEEPIGHVFNVINRPEGVVFLDGQRGTLGELSPKATKIILAEYSGRKLEHPDTDHQLPDEDGLPSVLTGPVTPENAPQPGRHDTGTSIPSRLKPAGNNTGSTAHPAATVAPPEGTPAATLPDTRPQRTRAVQPDTPPSTAADAPPPGSPAAPDTLLLERDSPLPGPGTAPPASQSPAAAETVWMDAPTSAVPWTNDRGDQVGVSFSAPPPSPVAVTPDTTRAPAPSRSVWPLATSGGARVGTHFSSTLFPTGASQQERRPSDTPSGGMSPVFDSVPDEQPHESSTTVGTYSAAQRVEAQLRIVEPVPEVPADLVAEPLRHDGVELVVEVAGAGLASAQVRVLVAHARDLLEQAVVRAGRGFASPVV